MTDTAHKDLIDRIVEAETKLAHVTAQNEKLERGNEELAQKCKDKQNKVDAFENAHVEITNLLIEEQKRVIGRMEKRVLELLNSTEKTLQRVNIALDVIEQKNRHATTKGQL